MAIFHLSTSNINAIMAEYIGEQMVVNDDVKIDKDDILIVLGEEPTIIRYEKVASNGFKYIARAVLLKKLSNKDNPNVEAGKIYRQFTAEDLLEFSSISSSSSTIESLSSSTSSESSDQTTVSSLSSSDSSSSDISNSSDTSSSDNSSSSSSDNSSSSESVPSSSSSDSTVSESSSSGDSLDPLFTFDLSAEPTLSDSDPAPTLNNQNGVGTLETAADSPLYFTNQFPAGQPGIEFNSSDRMDSVGIPDPVSSTLTYTMTSVFRHRGGRILSSFYDSFTSSWSSVRFGPGLLDGPPGNVRITASDSSPIDALQTVVNDETVVVTVRVDDLGNWRAMVNGVTTEGTESSDNPTLSPTTKFFVGRYPFVAGPNATWGYSRFWNRGLPDDEMDAAHMAVLDKFFGGVAWDANTAPAGNTFSEVYTRVLMSTSVSPTSAHAPWSSQVVTGSGKYYTEFVNHDGLTTAVGLSDGTDHHRLGAGGGTKYGYAMWDGDLTGGSAFGDPVPQGGTCSVLLDLDAGEIYFWVDGVDQGLAFTGVSSTKRWRLTASRHNAGNLGDVSIRRQGDWLYTPPVGYVAFGADS